MKFINMKQIFIIAVLMTSCICFAENAAIVRNTKMGLKSNVIDFREDGLIGVSRDNSLTPVSPKKLDVGDVFIDLDGNAKRVACITKCDNGDIYIDTVVPDIYEVLDFLDVPDQTIRFTEDNITADSMQYIKDVSDTRQSYRKEINRNIFRSENLSVDFSARINSEINLIVGCRLPSLEKYGKWYEIWKIRKVPGYAKADFLSNQNIGGNLIVNVNVPKMLANMPIVSYGSPMSGVSACVDLNADIRTAGSNMVLTPSVSFVSNIALAASCDLGGVVPIVIPSNFVFNSSKDVIATAQLVADGQVDLDINLNLVGSVKILGFSLLDIKFICGAGINLKSKLDAAITYTLSNGVTTDIKDGPEGTVGITFKGNGAFFKGKIQKSFFDYYIPVYNVSPANAN